MSYPLLEPGTLVKPQIHGGRFCWVPVISDPGPAEKRDRRITLHGRKGLIVVRRDRVHTGFDPARFSDFDSVFIAPGQKPPPGFKLLTDENFNDPDKLEIPDFLKRTVTADGKRKQTN